MRKLWAIISREYLERVRTWWFILSTALAPLGFALLLFLPPWLSEHSERSREISRIVILDATGAGLGKRIAVELNGGIDGDTMRTRVRELTPRDVHVAEEVAAAEVRRRQSKGYLVVDGKTLAGLRARYAGTNATAALEMAKLRGIVRDAVLGLRIERAGVSPAEAAALTEMSLQIDAERMTEGGRGGTGNVNLAFALGVAFLLYTSILIYGQNVMRGVMEEKQTRVAEVVVSSVSATKLLAGKVLGVGAVGLTQLLLWLGTSLFLARSRATVLGWLGVSGVPAVDLPHVSLGVLALLIAYFVLGFVFYSSLFAAVGAVVNSEQEAQQVQLPVALLLVGSGVFIQPILLSPDGSLAETMSWIPFSAPIAMPLRLSVIPISGSKVAFSLISLLVGCYLAVLIAARIYRVGLLLYGKQPSASEIWRWVRYAR